MSMYCLFPVDTFWLWLQAGNWNLRKQNHTWKRWGGLLHTFSSITCMLIDFGNENVLWVDKLLNMEFHDLRETMERRLQTTPYILILRCRKEIPPISCIRRALRKFLWRQCPTRGVYSLWWVSTNILGEEGETSERGRPLLGGRFNK